MTRFPKAPLSDSPKVFAASVLLLGSVVALVLVLLDVPAWSFYLAPMAGLPLLFWELHALSAAERELHGTLSLGIGSHEEKGRGASYAADVQPFDEVRVPPREIGELWGAIAWAACGIAISSAVGALTTASWISQAALGFSALVAAAAFIAHRDIRRSITSVSFDILEELVEHKDQAQRQYGAVGPRAKVRMVSPETDGWVVQRPDAQRVSGRYKTQSEALQAAREVLNQEGGGQLIIHGSDGRIRDMDTIQPRKNRPAKA
jgi:hypothetical protein